MSYYTYQSITANKADAARRDLTRVLDQMDAQPEEIENVRQALDHGLMHGNSLCGPCTTLIGYIAACSLPQYTEFDQHTYRFRPFTEGDDMMARCAAVRQIAESRGIHEYTIIESYASSIRPGDMPANDAAAFNLALWLGEEDTARRAARKTQEAPCPE